MSFLPFAEDDNVLEDIKGSLAQIALKDGKPDPAILRALDDPVSLRRVTAAEALCQGGRDDLVIPVRKLLKDPKPAVRLRVALALAQFRDPNAVGTLIKLLAELPTPLAKQAEDYLVNLAGEQSQKFPPLGDDVNAHKKCSDAWDAWWKTTEDCTKLVQEFKKRTLDDNNRDKVLALIKQLGDDSFDVREKADADLVALGEAAVPLLRQNMNNQDPEVSQRIRKVLETGREKAAAASAVKRPACWLCINRKVLPKPFWVTCLSPRMRTWLKRCNRPSRRLLSPGQTGIGGDQGSRRQGPVAPAVAAAEACANPAVKPGEPA